MLKNYFFIAFRNLWKNKIIASINILGLSLGLACFSLILLYVVNEFNYDRFHAKADHIYRVYRSISGLKSIEDSKDAHLPMPLGPAFKADFPDDVASTVRMRYAWNEDFVKVGETTTRVGISFADPNFFEVFSFPLLKGDSKTVIQDPYSVVLSESTAKRLFGNENPVGKTLEIMLEEEFNPYTVTGVAKDMPANSSINFEILCNFERLYTTNFGQRSVDNWNRAAFLTFVELKPGSTLMNNQERLNQFWKKYYPTREDELKERGEWDGKGTPLTYGMQPLKAMHTDTTIPGGITESINPRYGWILLGIGAIILLIACINFTTLAIGRSAGRTREIGVRKIVGANRPQLLTQFLTESFLLTVLSMTLGLGIGKLLLPIFNTLADRTLAWNFALYPELGGLFAGLILLVTLLAGAYPALILSGFKPIEILRNKLRLKGANWFTNSLVSFQFVLSIGLIACTVIMLNQLSFLRSKNPGFQKENVLVINGEGADTERLFPLLRQELDQFPGITNIATAELALGEGTGWSRSGFDYKGEVKQVYEYFVDPDYIPVLGMELIEGRNFDYKFASDSLTAVIVNEAMVGDFGWTNETAVGQELTGYANEGNPEPVVIGVVKNFNFQSLHGEVMPQMFHMFHDYTPFQMFVRLRPGDPAPTIAAIERTWKKLEPNLPLQYSFLDENLERFYQSDARWGRIVGIAGGLSVLLACLGLFGLTSLVMVNRTKEVGIRKVLGATIASIVALLSKDFLRLVVLAAAIAIPLAWWAMNQWLQDFAYRIEIQWWMFALAGIAAFAIALLTVTVQVMRAAMTNPVESLRSE